MTHDIKIRFVRVKDCARVRVTGTVRVAVTVTVCYRFCAIGHVLDGARVTESRYR